MRARSASALSTKAMPPLPFTIDHPPRTPSTFSNKITAEEITKICKGFSERSTARLKLFNFRLKAGSNLGVKSHHKELNYRLKGDFFYF